MPARPRLRQDFGSLLISTADTTRAVSNPHPIKLLLFDCSATKLCPNGTTLSSRNCKIVLAWFLSTLFVTFGMATWPALDGGRPAESPVLLLPVAIKKKEGSNSYYIVSTGNFQTNLVLLNVLEDQFKLKLHPENLLPRFAGDEDKGTSLDIKGLCENIQRGMADARGFEIGLRVILGSFPFQKMAMENLLIPLLSRPVCA
jgi:hypothetical protein